MSKEKVLDIVLIVLTALVMVARTFQAGIVLDCTNEDGI